MEVVKETWIESQCREVRNYPRKNNSGSQRLGNRETGEIYNTTRQFGQVSHRGTFNT